MNDESSPKPYLVLIGGAPGSGKSTLARKLTQYVQFIYIDADAVLENFWLNNTANSEYDRETVGMPRLYDLVAKNASDYNLNQVVDMAPTDSKTIEKLKAVSTLKHLHCQTDDANKRFYEREISQNGDQPDWLGPQMKELEEKIVPNSRPADLGIKVIEVKTDDKYTPSIKSLVEIMNIPEGYKLWSKFG